MQTAEQRKNYVEELDRRFRKSIKRFLENEKMKRPDLPWTKERIARLKKNYKNSLAQTIVWEQRDAEEMGQKLVYTNERYFSKLERENMSKAMKKNWEKRKSQ